MGDSENPLVPAAYDVVWIVVAALVGALAIVAVVSIGRHAKRLTSSQALIWTVVAIFIPVVGPLAWLSIGRPSVLAELPRQRSDSGGTDVLDRA